MPQTEIAASAGAVLHASANGQLLALDGRTGTQRWITTFPARTGSFQLAADQNAVIVQQGDRLFEFDPSTGAKRWSARAEFRERARPRPRRRRRACDGATVHLLHTPRKR